MIFRPAKSITTVQSWNLREIDRLVSRTCSHERMWLDRASCLGLNQLVPSLELLAYQHMCNGSAGGG